MLKKINEVCERNFIHVRVYQVCQHLLEIISQDILASLMISVGNPREIQRSLLLRILNISQDPQTHADAVTSLTYYSQQAC